MNVARGWPFLTDPGHPFLSMLWEIAAHGVLGLLVLSPLVRGERAWRRLGLMAFVGGAALDIDHIVAARSLSLHAMESMSGRPPTHSLTFALLLGGSVVLLTRQRLAGWVTFALITSHIIFDAAGGGVRLLYPLPTPTEVPWLVCPVTIAALLVVSSAIATRRRSTATHRTLRVGELTLAPAD